MRTPMQMPIPSPTTTATPSTLNSKATSPMYVPSSPSQPIGVRHSRSSALFVCSSCCPPPLAPSELSSSPQPPTTRPLPTPTTTNTKSIFPPSSTPSWAIPIRMEPLPWVWSLVRSELYRRLRRWGHHCHCESFDGPRPPECTFLLFSGHFTIPSTVPHPPPPPLLTRWRCTCPHKKNFVSRCSALESPLAINSACSVCETDFSQTEPVLSLPCQHIFHKDCLLPWIKKVCTLIVPEPLLPSK